MDSELIFTPNIKAAIEAEKESSFQMDVGTSRTSSTSSRVETGMYRVKVKKFAVDVNEGHPALSVWFQRLDNNQEIKVSSHFLEQFPYDKPELSYDEVHDMLSLCGFKNSREKVISKNFDKESFQDICDQGIGTELIVLVRNRWSMHNKMAKSVGRLRLAVCPRGMTYDEVQHSNETRNELVLYATELCDETTHNYREYFGERKNDDVNLTLLEKDFKSYVYKRERARAVYLDALK